MSKQLLLGDEAIAQAALDAGLSGVYAYPGTPSTEITEYIQMAPITTEQNIHNRWCANEKTAMEAALGMSFVGKRALVCMKHVGMNVAADCFVNSAITGVKGGLIVIAADDPSMHSSQNEQDSRFYGDFSLIPMYEPSNQQEAYDMVYSGFEFSEKVGEPILMRMVTRLAHSRSGVERKEQKPQNSISFSEDPRQFILLPGNARKRYKVLLARQDEFIKASEEEADEAECYPFFGETLELDKMILDLLVLNAPVYGLCKPDCKGLCPVCGCDLNLMQCSCSRTVKNANFASLEELAQLLNNEEEV